MGGVLGCTDGLALNYSSCATEESGTCLYEEDLVNNCPADLNGNGNVGTGDLLLMLGMLGDIVRNNIQPISLSTIVENACENGVHSF